MQTVKALIINSANKLDNRYLLPLIDTLKTKDNPDYPSVDKKEKTKLSCCRFFYLILLSEKSMKLCQN